MSLGVAIQDSVAEFIRPRTYVATQSLTGQLTRKLEETYLSDYSVPLTRPRFVEGRRFELLADSLYRDTAVYSNPHRVTSHPAMSELRLMRRDVLIPLVLKRIDAEPSVWLSALPALTGATPVAREHRGRVRQMIADWRTWAKSNGYLND